jgi:hypothetical protein
MLAYSQLIQPQAFLPCINEVAKDFSDRIDQRRYVNNEVNDLKMEVSRMSLETLANVLWDCRLGAFDDEASSQKMIENHEKIQNVNFQS